MNMKNKIIYISLLALLGAFACTEKDLKLVPTTPGAATFYELDANVEAALWAAYDPMQWNGNWGTTQITFGNLASDDAVSGGAAFNDQPTFQNSDSYTVSQSDNGNNLGNCWSGFFQGVNRCDLIIFNVSPSNAFRKQAIAEAKFMKAQYYFYLTRMFGGLPTWTKLPLPADQIKRSSQDDTYTFMENLLLDAINSGDLQQRANGLDPANGRATLASAQAYLGKTYLYHACYNQSRATELYNKAITVLRQIADNTSNYALEPDYGLIFLPRYKHGIECIFEINFTSQPGSANFNQAEGNVEDRLYGPRSNGFQIDANYDFGWGFNQPTIDLVKAYKAQNDTIRLKASCISSDSLQKLHKIWNSKLPVLTWVNELTGYWDNKHYMNPKYNPGATNIRMSHDRILMRVADVYLMLAEAYNRIGDDGNAKIYLNKVRARVLLAPVTSTGADLYAAIKLERRLELSHEGERYFDLVRWGDADVVLGTPNADKGIYPAPANTYATGTPGTKTHGLFPIPILEMNRTSGPNALTQNEGY